MNWGARRQFTFISFLSIFFLIVVGVPLYFKYFKKEPTCFDGKQNQNELDVDCGGVCKKLCEIEAREPFVVFEKIFPSGRGDDFAVALVENLNKDAYSIRAPYVLKVYDKNNILLAERFGEVFLPTGKVVAISEHSLSTGEREAFSAHFDFLNIEWQRGNLQNPSTSVFDIYTDFEKENPVVKASIKNNEVFTIYNVKAIIFLFDEQDNVIASSQNYFEFIPSQAVAFSEFVWFKEFPKKPVRVEIYIDSEKLK